MEKPLTIGSQPESVIERSHKRLRRCHLATRQYSLCNSHCLGKHYEGLPRPTYSLWNFCLRIIVSILFCRYNNSVEDAITNVRMDVKVMLRIPPVSQNSDSGSSFISLDSRKKQVTVYDPSTCGFVNNPKSGNGQSQTSVAGRSRVTAPKIFAFDAIFSQDDSQTEVCCSALTDIIQAVVNGADGCLFCYGHGELGKTYTMIGETDSSQKLGIIPCAISWLFRMIHEQKTTTGARFSVRMSAVEVVGRTEALNDLLAEQAAGTENSGQSPGIYLLDDPVLGTHLQNQSELRAPNAEKAAYYLDAALASRYQDEDGSKNSHVMITLHVYQYRIDKTGKSAGVAGGRSRLHMFDLGSCTKITKSETSLSLSALGNVIIAIFNGQKHVPYKESKLTQLLKEALSSITCRAAMIAHISTLPSQYSETLCTIQLAARIHRMRRKKMRFPMASGLGDASCESRMRSGMRSATSSDPDATSSSEQSCDTVIYVGPNGTPLSDRDLTDNEGPPKSLPVFSKLSIAPPVSNSNNLSKTEKVCEVSQSSESANAIKINEVKSRTLEKTKNRSGVSSSALPSHSAKPEEVSSSTSQRKVHSKEKSSVNSVSAIPESKVKSALVETTVPIHSSGIKLKVPPATAQPNFSTAVPAQNSPIYQSSSRKPSKYGHHSKPKQPSMKESKSDEQWVDGPRVSKQKMESVGAILQQKGNERWVDGPASYGYMDDHKRTMIERWVELHSTHKKEPADVKKPVKLPNSAPKEPQKVANVVEEIAKQPVNIDVSEKDSDQNKKSTVKKETKHRLTSSRSTQSMSESDHLSEEMDKTSLKSGISGSVDLSDNEGRKSGNVSSRASSNEPVRCNDTSTSPMHQESTDEDVYEGEETSDDDIDEEDYDDYDDQNLEESECAGETECESFECIKIRGKVVLEYAQSEDDDHLVEIIEVEEPDEPVPMVDSCIQVNEEDIIACMILQSEGSVSSENPLPEVDQDSEDGHPLRVLSEENLASSFTDSRSVSVDMEHKHERDNTDCESTCSSLSRQLILTSPSAIQRNPRSKSGNSKGFDDLGSVLKSETFTEKLERIAKLRQCYQQQSDMKVYENINSGASTPNSTLSKHSLPTSRINLDDLFYKKKQTLDDLESIYSEPMNINNLEKGLKPMNGLKLETFYSQMRRVPPPPPVLPDRPELLKPTQIVSPLINNDEDCLSNMETSLFKSLELLPSRCKSNPDSPGFCPLQTFSEPPSAALTPSKSEYTSLRHPDGASDTNLNKHPSLRQIYDEVLTITTNKDLAPQVELRSPGNGASSSDAEDRLRSNSESRLNSMLRVVPGQFNVHEKKQRDPQPSKLSKLSRFLGGRNASSPVKSSSSSRNSSPKSNSASMKLSNESKSNPKFSPRLQIKNWGKNKSKLPSRSLPTSPPTDTRKEIKPPSGKQFCVESTSEQSIQSLAVSSNDKKHFKSPPLKLPTPAMMPKSKVSSTNLKSTPGIVVGPNPDKASHKKESIDKKVKSPSKQSSTKHSIQSNNQKSSNKKQTFESSNDPEYDSGNDSGVVTNHLLSSPYSRLTKPKVERHSSSGHGSSDNSSTLSGDHTGTPLITPMHTTKVISRAPQPSGTSSGYESTIRDSEEGTGSSSNHDSASDSSGGGIARDSLKTLRKKPQGFRSYRGFKTAVKKSGVHKRSKGRQKKCERLEIVYHNKLMKIKFNKFKDHFNIRPKGSLEKSGITQNAVFLTSIQSPEVLNARHRSMKISKLRAKQACLKLELAATKSRIMAPECSWSYDCKYTSFK
ncbi:Kinesin-like protein KIF26A [Nymphon striatum]|nr:Kinesin-like protein KIF26A [Nymphon striatum]